MPATERPERHHAISHSMQKPFFCELQRWLDAGWKLVSGSLYATSYQIANTGTLPASLVGQDGVCWRPLFVCVVFTDQDEDTVPTPEPYVAPINTPAE